MLVSVNGYIDFVHFTVVTFTVVSVAQGPQIGATTGAEPTPSTLQQSTIEPIPLTSQQVTSQAQESRVFKECIASSRRRSCPLCQKTVDHLRRHVEKYHLHWYFWPELACWQCQESCVTSGQLWRVHGGCSGGALKNSWLKVWVATMWGWIHLTAQFAGCQGLNSLLDKFLDEKWFDRQGGVITSFTRSTLLWWVQVTRVCQRGTPESSLLSSSSVELESLPMDVAGLKGLFWMDGAVGEPAVRIDLGIWNCVFANSCEFSLPATGVTTRRTYGVHPHPLGQQLPWFTLLHLFGAEECCGIGECGLDETNMEAQEELFKTQVRAALKTRKQLVPHLCSTSSSTALLHQRARTLIAAVLKQKPSCLSSLFCVDVGHLHEVKPGISTAPAEVFPTYRGDDRISEARKKSSTSPVGAWVRQSSSGTFTRAAHWPSHSCGWV